eukprot:9403692-Heterocapsa_arctica.AAC.1
MDLGALEAALKWSRVIGVDAEKVAQYDAQFSAFRAAARDSACRALQEADSVESLREALAQARAARMESKVVTRYAAELRLAVAAEQFIKLTLASGDVNAIRDAIEASRL